MKFGNILLGHKPSGSLTGHYTKLNPSNYHGIVTLLDKNIKSINSNTIIKGT